MTAWNLSQAAPSASPITVQTLHDIARIFWGSEEAADESTYDGKALAAVKIQNMTYLKDALGLCDFAWPISYSHATPDYVGDRDLEAKIFTAVTGKAGEELERYAERIANLQRLILLREGRRTPQADYPPEFNFTEPLLDMPHAPVSTVPGPNNQAVSWLGNKLDRDSFAAMLQEYYRLRGWDEVTGIPKAETLKSIGLDAG